MKLSVSICWDELRVRFDVQTQGVHDTLSEIWWTFAEFVDSYRTFSVFPVESIDSKAIYNINRLRLISLNGRENYGGVSVNGMGYIQGEHEYSMPWILSEFKKYVIDTLKLVSINFSYHLTHYVPTCFRNSDIFLNDWYQN